MNAQISARKKLQNKITNKVAVTVREHDMLKENDHILIGLSGGKDSMILLESLAERKSGLPFNIEITAAHIHLESVAYKAKISEMEALCSKLDVNFITREVKIEEGGNKKKGICFLCSWQRRKTLFDLTAELNCNKLALGHHRNDALETLLLNMIYHGSISSMPYKLSMFNGRIELIRPLLDLDNNLLRDYALLREFNSEGLICEHEKKNRREDIRKLLSEIEQLHGSGRINMFRSMDKIIDEYLPRKKARTS